MPIESSEILGTGIIREGENKETKNSRIIMTTDMHFINTYLVISVINNIPK